MIVRSVCLAPPSGTISTAILGASITYSSAKHGAVHYSLLTELDALSCHGMVSFSDGLAGHVDECSVVGDDRCSIMFLLCVLMSVDQDLVMHDFTLPDRRCQVW